MLAAASIRVASGFWVMRNPLVGRCLAGVMMASLIVALAACGGRGSDVPPARPSGGAAPTVPIVDRPAVGGVPVLPTPGTDAETGAADVPRLPAPSEGAELVRLVIPKARVDHRLVVRGLNERREMEDPGGKDDIAWYNFSTLPGLGSNAVFSGHVDWYTGQPGVFWYLREVNAGDEIDVYYSDGLTLKYRVSRIEVYGAHNAPVSEITAPTAADMLTMITCDGVFSKNTGDYNQRRVVWAERVA